MPPVQTAWIPDCTDTCQVCSAKLVPPIALILARIINPRPGCAHVCESCLPVAQHQHVMAILAEVFSLSGGRVKAVGTACNDQHGAHTLGLCSGLNGHQEAKTSFGSETH